MTSSLRLSEQRKIVLVTGRWDAGLTLYPTMKLLEILKQLSSKIIWVVTKEGGIEYADNCVRVVEIPDRLVAEPFFANLGCHLLHQLRVSYTLLRTGNSPVIFAFGSDLALIPILVVRALGRKVILRTDGRPSEVVQRDQKRYSPLKVILFRLVERCTYGLASRVVPESHGLIPLYGLASFSVMNSGALFVDTNAFTAKNPLHNRQFLIGFVGRLSEEKGILEFAGALPLILADQPREKAIIIGDGHLRHMIALSIMRGGVSDKIQRTGKIENWDLPRYLNEIRLLVIPSQFEGLPNILLEAMACGTLVLATPVGAIPDVIVDGRTGFIMEDNSPDCIAKNVTRVLNSSDSEQVAENGRRFVEEHFTFEHAVARWKEVLEGI